MQRLHRREDQCSASPFLHRLQRKIRICLQIGRFLPFRDHFDIEIPILLPQHRTTFLRELREAVLGHIRFRRTCEMIPVCAPARRHDPGGVDQEAFLQRGDIRVFIQRQHTVQVKYIGPIGVDHIPRGADKSRITDVHRKIR